MSDSDNSGARQNVWTISNVITIARILLVPVFVAALLAPWPEWFGLSNIDGGWKPIVATGVFVIISCTDWLDGYLARSRNEITDFGKFMDPLADKILVCAALISLVELGSLPTWVVLIILAREFIVSGVRMMAASKGVVIAASMLGKFKTVFQMIAIVLFTIKDSHMIGDFSLALADKMWVVSWFVMLIALALTIASMVDYLYKGREILGFASPSADEGDNDPVPSDDIEKRIEGLATRVIGASLDRNLTLATAESLTGGMIGAALTSVPGSSAAFKGGIVSYTNEVKQGVLGVEGIVLDEFGAVSSQTAESMARCARERLEADIAVSVTGIAGPGGEEPGKPVGTVWMGLAAGDGVHSRLLRFEGDRDAVRRQTVESALAELIAYIDAR